LGLPLTKGMVLTMEKFFDQFARSLCIGIKSLVLIGAVSP
jgi:hypothetical protein